MKALFPENNCLPDIIGSVSPDKIFLLTDKNVERLVLPGFKAENSFLSDIPVCSVKPGENSKSLPVLEKIWLWLLDHNASRKSLLINLGGGMITDLGGFAAATFKRGINFINITTTLLAAADASVGGKTGINLGGVKNAVGSFAHPIATFFSPGYFSSLSREQIMSGYGEIVKTAFLTAGSMTDNILDLDMNTSSPEKLENLLRECVRFKMNIVCKDPDEKGLRKILNFGHTAGHAFESLMNANGETAAHGIAVAHGIMVALILSNMKLGMESVYVSRYASFLKMYYPAIIFHCGDYPKLLGLMRQDKKNTGTDKIMFTLLEKPGKPVIDAASELSEIETALDIYRDYTGI